METKGNCLDSWIPLLNSLGGTECHQAMMHHLQMALHPFFKDKIETCANLSILKTMSGYLSLSQRSSKDVILQTSHSE